MAMRVRQCAVLAIAGALVIGSAAGQTRQSATYVNPANDKLVQLSPPARAGTLARAVGHWCIGTETFAMGVVAAGSGAGNAYWSLRCADGTAWAIQVDPSGEVIAIDCDSFKEAGAGKACFKKF